MTGVGIGLGISHQAAGASGEAGPLPPSGSLFDRADTWHVVLAMGQSNMVGWDQTEGPDATLDAGDARKINSANLGVALERGWRGATTVSGTSRMDPAFVAYYAGLKVGEKFDPDRIDRARDQLRRLETFNAVRIVEADEVTNEGTLPITLEVAERKRFVVGGGALFSSVDGFGLEGYWRDRNLFGRGEKLGVEASAGGIDGDNPNGYNYSLALSFLKPGVFTPYTDFASRIYAEQLAPTTFRARTVGANAGFKHRLHIASGFGTHFTQTVAFITDYNALLTRLFNQYQGADVPNLAIPLKLFNFHRTSIGQFLSQLPH